jgi:hypothetical protein
VGVADGVRLGAAGVPFASGVNVIGGALGLGAGGCDPRRAMAASTTIARAAMPINPNST